MKDWKKELLFGGIFTVVVLFFLIPWPFTHASVPDDVRDKLGSNLIGEIERSWWHMKIKCSVDCGSSDSMYTVIDTLAQRTVDSIGYVLDASGRFSVSLTPEEIFTIARIEEVLRITFNGQIVYPLNKKM